MVKEKMVEIKANQRRSNVCTIGDIKEEKAMEEKQYFQTMIQENFL